MHIPDGYLGPVTVFATVGIMLPVWTVAARKASKTLKARQVPLLALAAAFSFVIMMFNVPIPGGTTGHAVGAVLTAILLGPWAACIAISVVLIVQALVFGDGGITAIGANCFNMAFVEVFVGYFLYSLVSGSSAVESPRRVMAAGVAGYIAIVVAAFSAGLMFGLQPLLHKTASGQALYCPYGFRIAIPAMVGSHALVFGWVEGAVTAAVVKYLQSQEPTLLEARGEVRA